MSDVQPVGSNGRVTLRVTAAQAEPVIFDALLLFTSDHASSHTRRVQGQGTPFELALPDEDVTVVVRPRDPRCRVVAEYERVVGDRRVLVGRSWQQTPVLQRRRGGILCTGLSSDDPPSQDGAEDRCGRG